MKHDNFKTRVIALIVCIMILGSSLATAASTTAFDRLSSSHVAKVYTLENKDYPVYTNKNLNTRGTETYGKSKTAYINGSDELWVLDVDKNSKGVFYAYISYSIGNNKRAKAYIPLSTISTSLGNHNRKIATKRFNMAKRPGYSTVSSWYVDAGDETYLLSKYDMYVQLLYPISGGDWRIAWCKLSTYNSCTESGNGKLVTQAEIDSAAKKWGISKSSNAYGALLKINSYYNKLSNASGPLVFLFEGTGANQSANKRMNATCIVVKNHKIVYVNIFCSTIPDYPFNPAKNKNTAMPTIKSGVYNFVAGEQSSSSGNYAALHILSARVVRHSSKSKYWSSTSDGINIHRRSNDNIAPASAWWVNSAGCQVIGRTPDRSTASEYARFIQAVGIAGKNDNAYSKCRDKSVTGKVIIDRSQAKTYLKNIGYSNGAIELIGV